MGRIAWWTAVRLLLGAGSSEPVGRWDGPHVHIGWQASPSASWGHLQSTCPCHEVSKGCLLTGNVIPYSPCSHCCFLDCCIVIGVIKQLYLEVLHNLIGEYDWMSTPFAFFLSTVISLSLLLAARRCIILLWPVFCSLASVAWASYWAATCRLRYNCPGCSVLRILFALLRCPSCTSRTTRTTSWCSRPSRGVSFGCVSYRYLCIALTTKMHNARSHRIMVGFSIGNSQRRL